LIWPRTSELVQNFKCLDQPSVHVPNVELLVPIVFDMRLVGLGGSHITVFGFFLESVLAVNTYEINCEIFCHSQWGPAIRFFVLFLKSIRPVNLTIFIYLLIYLFIY